MIEVKRAVLIAMNYIREIYDSNVLKALMVEEVQLSEDGKLWKITIGFARSKFPQTQSPMQAALAGMQGMTVEEYERVYKIIEVHTDTGEATAMRIL